MYFFKPPVLQKVLFPYFIWEQKSSEKVIYLTFDDGPTSEVTPFVLDLLKKYNAKATFFLVGNNVNSNPHLVQEIAQNGHAIGNHTQNHVSGWSSRNDEYFEDIKNCDDALEKLEIKTRLFRPPFGRIKWSQAQSLKSVKKVVMWSFLTGDFDQKLNIAHSLSAVKKMNSGAILVFHDTEMAFNNLKNLLPETLSHFSQLGFQFKSLENEAN